MSFPKQSFDKSFSVIIDGKKVDLRINRSAIKLYKSRFGLDLFKVMDDHLKLKEMNLKQSDQMAQIIWAFAKTANHTIPEYEVWLDRFEVFPLADIFTEIAKKLKE